MSQSSLRYVAFLHSYSDNWFNLLSHYEEDDYLEMRHFVEERLAAARRENAKVGQYIPW